MFTIDLPDNSKWKSACTRLKICLWCSLFLLQAFSKCPAPITCSTFNQDGSIFAYAVGHLLLSASVDWTGITYQIHMVAFDTFCYVQYANILLMWKMEVPTCFIVVTNYKWLSFLKLLAWKFNDLSCFIISLLAETYHLKFDQVYTKKCQYLQ
jgi:hypothetical protein